MVSLCINVQTVHGRIVAGWYKQCKFIGLICIDKFRAEIILEAS